MRFSGASKQWRVTAVWMALLLAGCVSGDMRETLTPTGPGSGLSSEQRWHLREAAKSGEPDLLATAARMSWDYPEQKAAIAGFTQRLMSAE
jgi:hypothetical protein